MKEKELREAAVCGLCNKNFGETGLPYFYRVEIKCYGVDQEAINRQAGLTAIIGDIGAAAMGLDEDLATVINKTAITVCADCFAIPLQNVAELMALGEEQ